MTVYHTKEDVGFNLLYCVLLINCTWVYYFHMVVHCIKHQPPHEIITCIGYQEEADQQ